ncbi:16S rRNA (guanine(527)-N(7))-methyltransferase RsmG [Desulfonema magnum]|uniref:Ribosomal RNA small subunit methyltransferase G n=1 Tax=Desulfonema magnum TaxID=45655 RepID=A0A975GQE7_9BACT|nr:16S rRNA (guanine(527)-N(7))-methyltransferase RsmG [Desulfonema magnum]QTA89802.1 Ribosomal RNA small subunit methyltransferase G [Desulfonema magnum]
MTNHELRITNHKFPIGSAQWKYLIIEGAKTFDVCPDQEKTGQFAIHGLELLKWNRKMNLTAITDPLEVAVKHFLDSIAPAPVIPPSSSLLDIGSGGGFPGIPLKILIPSLSVTLIDTSRKKVSFQKHIIRTLKLGNIKARHIRAEDLAREKPFAKAFDVIICRALSSLDAFVAMARPLLAEHGMMIALKGKVSEAEIESWENLKTGKDGFSLVLKKYKLPYLGAERAIICLKRP